MAKHTNLSSLFSATADAIRAKKGTTDPIIADNFPDEIAALSSAAETETWEFTLEDDSVVTKEVQLVMDDEGGGITPTGEIPITSNGTYDVTDYASAKVNVPTTSTSIPSGYADVSGVTATAADVLASKTIVLSNGTPTNGNIQTRTSIDLYTDSTYPDRVYTKAGYYASNVYKSVGTASLPAPSITIDTVNERIVSIVKQTSSGYVAKNSENDATLSLPMQDGDEITPGKESQTAISAGYYAKGDITVAGDTDLVPGNIKSGVTIFGVTGSYVGSSGSSGHNSKIRFIQCTALSASGEVFSFVLDDYDFYNDYIKLIVGSIILRKSNYISYFLGEDRTGNGCGWELITYDGSKTDGNSMLSYAVSGNVVTIYSDGRNTDDISFSFAKGSTYSLYVVYGTP